MQIAFKMENQFLFTNQTKATETKPFLPIHMKNINEQYKIKHMKSHLFNKKNGLHKREINHYNYMADFWAEYSRFGKNFIK